MRIPAPEAAFADGRAIVLLGADRRLGGPELVVAAELVTPEAMAFVVRHTCGFVTVSLPAWRCDELDLPALAWRNDGVPVPAVTVDAAEGVSTGISAADRAHTARLLAAPNSFPSDFTRPGHLVPVRCYPGAAASTASAALELCGIVGTSPAAVRCEIVIDSGELTSDREALEFADVHGLAVLHVRDLLPIAA